MFTTKVIQQKARAPAPIIFCAKKYIYNKSSKYLQQ
jgi:hypothetical protein